MRGRSLVTHVLLWLGKDIAIKWNVIWNNKVKCEKLPTATHRAAAAGSGRVPLTAGPRRQIIRSLTDHKYFSLYKYFTAASLNTFTGNIFTIIILLLIWKFLWKKILMLFKRLYIVKVNIFVLFPYKIKSLK